MKHKLIDYRNDGENLYIYEYTDPTQEVAIYDDNVHLIGDTELHILTFIRDRVSGEILKYVHDGYSYNTNGYFELTVPINEEWGDEFIVDVFYIPEINNTLIGHYYLGEFTYQTNENLKELYRLKGTTEVGPPPYTTSAMTPNDDVGNDYWELVFYHDTNGDTEVIGLTMDDFENLLSQVRNSIWHSYDEGISYKRAVTIFHTSTGIELTVPEFPEGDDTVTEGNFVVDKIECNNYELRSNMGPATYSNIIITNEITGENITPEIEINPETGIILPYSFSVPGDGIYSIQVFYESDGNKPISETIIIYEYCEFKECYSKLAKDLYCSDLSCCDTCNDDCRYEIERRMYELNKMHALFSQLLLAIHGHRVNYLMYHNVGEVNYEEFWSSVKKLWEIIEIAVKRCGDCDPSHDQNNNPCNC